MNPKVLGIIILVVGLGIVLFVYNSGALTKISSLVQPPTSTSTGTSTSTAPFSNFFTTVFGPHAPISYPATVGSGQSNPSYNSGNGSAGAPATTVIPAYEIPTGLTAAQLSPYFHVIRFGGVGTGQISLYAYQQQNTSSSVDITGWEIRTNRGGEYIPQAVNIYNPSSANPESDIILPLYQSSNVYLYSNSAPSNVRINACMGYLNSTHQFNPALPYNCPSINRAQLSSFSGQCQDYILSLGSCGTADMSNPAIPQYDYACQQYLQNNFTYNACISNRSHDADFLSATWYVWMGGNPLDPYHDNVALLDRRGLIVDTYSY